MGGALSQNPPDRGLHDWKSQQEGTVSQREHVPEAYRRRAKHSDHWLAYEAAFPQSTHRFCGKETGKTNHAERFLGTVRARMGRLVRRAYSFSKREKRHPRAFTPLSSLTTCVLGAQHRFEHYSFRHCGMTIPRARYKFTEPLHRQCFLDKIQGGSTRHRRRDSRIRRRKHGLPPLVWYQHNLLAV